MANGEGYLRKRGKGYAMTIFLGKDENGKPRQMVHTFHGSEKDVKAEMARLIAERNQGVDLKPKEATFLELTQRWRDSHYPNLAESTSSTYETLLNVHALPILGASKLQDLKPLHVEAVKTAMTKKGCSQKSALNVFRLVSAILKQGVRWQLLYRNPADGVIPPRPRRYVAQAPTLAELAKVLATADDTPYGSVARLAALSGARQGELLSLTWRDVDWQAQTLTVRGTKTQSSLRKVDLGDVAVNLLRDHHKHELEKRLKLGPGADCGSNEATIFTNQVGKPMDAGGLKRTWKRIIRDAGVGHLRFHDLRHASATYMLQAGVPVQMVSARLGHSRTSTTTDIYAHVLPGMGRHAAEVLEKVMQA
ncbi:MAG TPA: tyrosine-type recombinase/integrase [Dehalococcoidia bacterium]|nr:tyrosine-type recombinase/integrase [Dehalococcoidia bacterium]